MILMNGKCSLKCLQNQSIIVQKVMLYITCFSTFIKLDKTKKNSFVHHASLMDLCLNFLYIQNKIMCFLPSYNKFIKISLSSNTHTHTQNSMTCILKGSKSAQ